MKHFSKLFKLFTLVMAMVAFGSSNAYASSSKTYYAKATATATGNGKVYVGTSNTASDAEYQETSEATNNVSSSSSPANVSFYLFAEPSDATTKFDGWYENADCTGTALSTDNPYNATISSNSTNQSSPVTKNYYAKFVEASAPTLHCETNHIYVDIDDEPTANDGVIFENFIPTYHSSNTAVATVAADGKVSPVGAGSAIITVSGDKVEDVTYIVTVLDYTEAGKTQIGNGGFEDWSNVTSSNHAPKNWNSFETNEGSWASMARAQQIAMSDDHRPGSNGLYSARIYSRSVLGVVAQGNLTLGCINAGSTSAVSKDNHNFSKITDPNKSETIDRIPSAIKVWVKFVPAGENAAHPNARVAATIHDAHNYITQGAPQFETEQNASYAVAQGAENFPACDWTELTIPFELTGNAVTDGQLYIIVNVSTNADPGQGQSGDALYIDDIELVYDNVDYDTTPLTMTDAKWATFCAPMDVNVPYGMKAYTVDGIDADDETVLALTEVEDVIPANTPVVLEGTAAANLKAYGFAAPATAEAGMLTGVYEDTTAPAGSYVLQNHEGVVGFYKVEGVQPTVKANSAYLNTPSAVKAFYFNAQDVTTAITKLNAETTSNAIYDLSGRRVQNAQKGIFIVNGKKVIK